MTANARETVETAFAALFDPLVSAGTLKFVSRRFRMWDQVQAGEKPCMFIRKDAEEQNAQNISTPNIGTTDLSLFIYVDSGKDKSVVPITAINTILDAVDKAINSTMFPGPQTLGGLVTAVKISGRIEIEDGSLDGNGVAYIPIKIIVP